MPAKKKEVIQNSTMRNCLGCDVLVQRDENIELNVNFHRQEMAERWRLQEADSAALKELVGQLSNSVNKYVTEMHGSNMTLIDRIHKLEKSVIYSVVAVGVSALGTIGTAVLLVLTRK